MAEEANKLKTTPLFTEHKSLGAYISGFGGFYMPIQYTGVINEHLWCRKSCAVFDTAHMGQFLLTGGQAEDELNQILVSNISNLPENTCKYTVMLNRFSGIIDDLIVYKINKNKFLLVVNAGTTQKDREHIEANIKQSSLVQRTPEYGKIDVQGPLSKDVLKDVLKADLTGLKYFSFDYFDLLGQECIISRTGYTGELGYEIYIKADKIVDIWRILLADKRVKPAGLAARDTLRLEAGLPLYGQDISEDINPWEAGLNKFVDLDKKFIGKQELLKKKDKTDKLLTYFVADSKRAPRHHYQIFSDSDDIQIGVVTSGTYSPTLQSGIGSGYIKKDLADLGKSVVIKHNGMSIKANIVRRPVSKDR